MDSILPILLSRKSELLQHKNEAEARLKKLKYKGEPKYRVHVDSAKNQYYLMMPDERSGRKYLAADKKAVAHQIASYDYLKTIIRQADSELKQIDKLIKTCENSSPEDYYESLSKGRQRLISPVKLTDEQFVEAWLSKPYTGGTFAEGDAEYYTARNERVRSKSEILIANALSKNNVPYKYECPIVLKGLGKIFPDFTALNVKRRKVYYWEHLGMMDDEDYARKSVVKINAYERNGFTQGTSLLITMETGKTPLDVKLVDNMIRRFLLN